MFPQGRHPTPHQAPGQPFKFTIPESLDRIKEEFQFLQAQYHSLKLECEKLASEKTEMQRHYVMYYEMSYGLNIEMHKQVSVCSLHLLVCVSSPLSLPLSCSGFLMYLVCAPIDVFLCMREHKCVSVLMVRVYVCFTVSLRMCGCVFIFDRWGSVSISPVRAGRLSPEAE
ncbi:hypothetical protein GOODEAATRI_001522 [Goodea atripinnis]|uniref:Groucho/TLE N-terminal Q-rich domain-containing protein n=1 Tax=Goodea atripinnis TaxID=208336 RepID=A0ABV0PK48_9TELE